jgi:hypothetical protein
MLMPAAAAGANRALSLYNTVVRFYQSKGSPTCRFQQDQDMRFSSTAGPLPTWFLARRIRLSAGSVKRVQGIDIPRLFGAEGAICEG